MKFSICNEFCEGMAIEDVFALAARLGYDGVEIAPFTLAKSVNEIGQDRRRAIARSARENGVEVVGLHWLLVSPEGLYLNHPEDEYVRQQTVNYLLDLIRFCSDLGGKIMVFGSPKQRNIVPGHSFGEAWEFAVEAFLKCMRAAKDRGVTICIEPLSTAETDFISTYTDAIRLVDSIGNRCFRMMLDVKAMSSESTPIPEIISASKAHVAHVHANDANRRGPGFGDTDFVPIFRALKRIRYDGYVSVEVFDFEPDGETIARESLRYMRKCLARA